MRPNDNSAFAEFLNEVDEARAEIKCSASGAFYRGHSNYDHKLVPSFLRIDKSDGYLEHNLYTECFARTGTLMPDWRNSWEFLSIMQHFGVPTRLLDWTESLGTAIFFALKHNHDRPHIWVTNAFMINRSSKASDTPRIFTVGLDDFPEYSKSYVDTPRTEDWQFEKPVFLQIPWSSNRIAAQKGFFTFHSNPIPMEESHKKYVRRVELPEAAIDGAKRFLVDAGINEHTIFPDLEGFGRFLKQRYDI